MKTYHTASSDETRRLGERFAARMLAESGTRATVIVLSGELGSGKTTFMQGIFRGAGIRRNAQSPTFVIMRRYAIPKGSRTAFKNLVHMDAYRLKRADQLAPLGFEALLADPRQLLVIEWGERIGTALPRNAQKIRFRHGKKENERTIVMQGDLIS